MLMLVWTGNAAARKRADSRVGWGRNGCQLTYS